jgi:hypothetical protein
MCSLGLVSMFILSRWIETHFVTYSAALISRDGRGWVYQGQLAYALQDLIDSIEKEHGLGDESQVVDNAV